MEVAGYSLAICHVIVCAAAGTAVKISATMSNPARRRRIIARTDASSRAPGEEVDALGCHDHLAVLVPHFHERADDSAVRLAPRRRRLENGQSPAEGVARAHGLEPLQLVNAGWAETDRVLEKPLVE